MIRAALIIILGNLFISPIVAQELPTGRNAWDCTEEAFIYPGWWDKTKGATNADGGTDGWRTAGPTVVRLGQGDRARYILYYLADQPDKNTPTPWIGTTRILRAEASVSDPTHFVPKNIAMDFFGPWGPKPDANDNAYTEEYYKAGPYYGAVLPMLDDDLEPARNADGTFKPWFMYYHTAGSALSVAVSKDGGVTFAPANKPGVNPLFPFQVFRDPKDRTKFVRQPVEEKSKVYDQSAAGSATGFVAPDGRIILYYTARMWNNYTLDDLGVTAVQVGHPDGHIPDYGIAYAESTDGLHFERRTALSLGATSDAARGVGRIIEPRFHNGPDGEFEYVVSRPMVFEDGTDRSGRPLYRMTVSSHSSTYRVRSLHSTDLINWVWDKSPAEGLFGFGKKGSFDDKSTTYSSCLVEKDAGNEIRCWYTGNGYGHVTHMPTGIGYCSLRRK